MSEKFGADLVGAVRTSLDDLLANFTSPGHQGPSAYAEQMHLDHPDLDAATLAADAVLAVVVAIVSGAVVLLDRAISTTKLESFLPHRWMVCKGPTNQACADEAARRLGKPVAWIPSTRQSRAFAMAAPKSKRGASVLQELSTQSGRLVTVYTEPQVVDLGDGAVFYAPDHGGDHSVIQIGGTEIQLKIYHGDSAEEIVGDWQRTSVSYRLSLLMTCVPKCAHFVPLKTFKLLYRRVV